MRPTRRNVYYLALEHLRKRYACVSKRLSWRFRTVRSVVERKTRRIFLESANAEFWSASAVSVPSAFAVSASNCDERAQNDGIVVVDRVRIPRRRGGEEHPNHQKRKRVACSSSQKEFPRSDFEIFQTPKAQIVEELPYFVEKFAFLEKFFAPEALDPIFGGSPNVG